MPPKLIFANMKTYKGRIKQTLITKFNSFI